MSTDLYAFSVPVFLRGLATLDRVLGKAEAHVTERKIEPSALLTDRLFPDMLTLTRQVQIATDTAKRSIGRLAAIEPPSFEDTESSFSDLIGRVQRTASFIHGVPSTAFAGADERSIELKAAGSVVTLSGLDYLVRFALPNFYFHVTTTYDICRHNGVAIGKADFLGSLSAP
jgi:uncharacterized protein